MLLYTIILPERDAIGEQLLEVTSATDMGPQRNRIPLEYRERIIRAFEDENDE